MASADSSLPFRLLETDPTSAARRGQLSTSRGAVEMPAFMPVGTQATIKALHPDEVKATGAAIILGNTYHLMIRPGADLIKQAGGLHRFMGWTGPILTDSGGFQIFSLAHNAQVSESGVRFRSHVNGDIHELSPESAVKIQLMFGSDIVMALDHFVGLPAERASVVAATERTARWLERCIQAFREHNGWEHASSLFGICQGGMEPDLRRESALMLASSDVAGCAIGGLSVGESKDVMADMLDEVVPILPPNKPRYLMGVGSPEDLWNGVAQGVDLFDCVLPTRLGRNGALFTPVGRVDIRSREYADKFGPVDEECDCGACTRFSAAYLHHLFRTKEILGLRLASIHNLRFLQRQMHSMRVAIEQRCFDAARSVFLDRYRVVGTNSTSRWNEGGDGQLSDLQSH